jgi:type II secretory ATPase GspE/PulE/Tfp pilus assembly ATPase PilB-like protein
LDILNTPKVNISALEDPVEYQMKRINQTQVKPDIGFDFSTGLRSLVRQDPDIIMVGEIRDAETASLAINAALTGHLVLSTLHTNSAAGAIPRLLDMGAKSFLIVSTIRVIIGQRLVRLLEGEKEEYFLDDEQLAELNEIADMDRVLKKLQEENEVDASADWSNVSFYRVPEKADPEEVYSGRRGIQEVLQVTETIKEMISADATADEIEQQAKDEGMLTMAEDGIFKAAKGFTTLEEVLRVVSE